MLSPASISAAKCMTPSKRPSLRVFSSRGTVGNVALDKGGLAGHR